MATAILLSAAGARGDVLKFDLQLPVPISGGDPSEAVLSSLPALQAASLEAVRITLMHEWLGDLTVKLISPNGAEVVLFDRVGAGSDGSSAILGGIQDGQPGSPVFSLVPQEYQFAEAGESFPNAAEAAVGTQILPVVPGDAVYAAQSWAFGTFTAGVWQLVVTDAAALSGGEIVDAELHYTPGTADPAVVTLVWQEPTEIVYGSALGPSELSATAMCGGVAVPGTFTYSPPAGTVLPAGAGQLLSVQFTPTDRSRFASAQGSVQITVRPANLVVTPRNATKAYGAPLPVFGVDYLGFVNGDDATCLTPAVEVGTSARADSPVGQYPITIVAGASPNYTIVPQIATLTVTKAALTVQAENKSKVYGAPLPSLTATYTGFLGTDSPASLTEPVTLSTYADATSPPGTYPIVVTGGASLNYTLSLESATLTVTKAALTVRAENKSMVCGAPLPALAAVYTGFVGTDSPASLTEPVTLSTSATVTSPPGTYPIVVTGGASPKYDLVRENGVLTVSSKPVLTIRAENKSKVYGAPLPSLTATYSGFVGTDTPASLTEPVTLSTSATATSPPGTYPIVISGGASPNYTLVLESGTLTVTRAALTVRAENKSKVYGALLPSLTATYSGFVGTDSPASLTEPVTLSTSATATGPPGTYPIVITGGASPNYTVVLESGILTVTKASLTVRAENKSKLYGALLPTFTATYSGFVGNDTPASLTEPVTLSTSATAISPPGTYPIVVTGGASPNYDLVRENGVLTVSSKPVLTIRAENKSKVYGAPLPSLTATYSGFVGTDTPASLTEPVTLSTSATATSPPGTYPIVVTGGASPNYTLVLESGTMTVTRAALTVRAENKSKLYGAQLPAFTATYSGFVGTDSPASLTVPVTLSTSATPTSPPGTYPIVVTGGASPKYDLVRENGVLTVSSKPVLTIRADNKSKVYGAPLPSLTVTYNGFVGNDSPASLTEPVTLSTSATATSPPGTYPIAVTGGTSSAYTVVLESGTMTVTKAALTVRAENKSKVYGAPLPSLTATYTGFVGNDSPASLTEPVTLSTSATVTSPPGTYPIVVTGGASPKYDLVRENGVLTVSSKPVLTIRADNKSKVYGAPLPSLTVTYNGFVGNDSPASLSEPVTLSTSATATSPPDDYPIVITGGVSSNYTLVLESGTLTVTKAPLTVVGEDKTKAYGAALPQFTASYAGFVKGDTPDCLDEPIVFTTPATVNSPVGTYPIEPSGGANARYTLQFVSGKLTIGRAPLTVTADPKTKVYGAPVPELTATYRGFVNGDTMAILAAPPSLSTAATAKSAPGAYQIRASGGASPINYTLVLNNGVLTVTKAPLIITAEDKRMKPGMAVPILTARYSGLAEGEGPNSLSQALKLTTTADSSSPPGNYPILPSGAASPNYEISFVPGTLTIGGEHSPPVLTVTSTSDPQGRIVRIPVGASPGCQVRLEWSEDLLSWSEAAAQTCTDNQVVFEIEVPPGASLRFFRAVLCD